MGGNTLDFDEVNVGDEAPVLTHSLTRADLVQYAGASGDFNPMHTDEVAAKEAGLQSVFGHGMFSAGLLATALTNWVGIGNLKSYNVRFVKQTWPGEEFSTRIRVTAKHGDDGGRVIELECSLANDSGEVKVAGNATAALP
jgi:acyl dehydratase